MISFGLVVVATTKKNANVALIFSFLHKLVKVSVGLSIFQIDNYLFS